MGVNQILMSQAKNQTEMWGTITNVATTTGLSVSIVLLCVHLLVFAVVDDLRNLPGKNLASFCVALLLEYSSTLVSGFLEGAACYVNEIAAYYFIMASAFWMLTMSYDVWQTLRCATQELVIVSGGRQCKKFAAYSACGWLTPALLTVLVFFALPRLLQDFDLDFDDFDEKRCLFGETKKMYVFVTSVFGTIFLFNTFFFAASVYYIFSTQSAIKRSTKNTAFFTHFQLYGRLSLIMGVTWTAEFVIYYAEFDILSDTFKVINTFEGLFIVVAFTLRKEVLEYVKSLPILHCAQNVHFYHYMSIRKL